MNARMRFQLSICSSIAACDSVPRALLENVAAIPSVRLICEIDSRSLVFSQYHLAKSTFSAQHAGISRSQL